MMTQWLLTHQPLLTAVIALNGAAVAALIIAVSYRPSAKEIA